jgi:hypothetical protein
MKKRRIPYCFSLGTIVLRRGPKENKFVSLLLRFGILAQGKLQQPADGLCPRFKAVGKPEIVNLPECVFIQAQEHWLQWRLGRHCPEYTRYR